MKTVTTLNLPGTMQRRETNGNDQQKVRHHSFQQVLGIPDFRRLWLSQIVGRLGDQFYLIALPWLVLKLTGDPLAMSLVLATASIPRAVFMLVGGALTDRFSATKVMLVSFIMRLMIVGLLASVVLTGIVQLWMIYGFAFLFGLVDAFYYPALNSSVPQMVNPQQLQAGNALIQGVGQLSQFAGPVLAGALIASLDGTRLIEITGRSNLFGIGLVFVLNTLFFLVSALFIGWIPNHSPDGSDQPKKVDTNVWQSIQSGLAYMRNDTALLTFFIVTAAITFLTNGPFAVGVPMLADTRFSGGAAAFGLILSAFGGGSLGGTITAGVLPKPGQKRFGVLLLGVSSVLGIGLAFLGMAPSAKIAAVIAFLMGIANGYVVISFITWVQNRTLAEFLGRMMSLLMFAMVGLNPISTAITGVLIKLNLTLVFVGAGSILVAILLISLINPAIRDLTPGQAKVLLTKDSYQRNGDEGKVYSTFDFAQEKK